MTCATPSVSTLGGYLRTARKARSMTLAEVGKKAGVHAVHICDIELNKRSASEALLGRLSEALEVPLPELERRDPRFFQKHRAEALAAEVATLRTALAAAYRLMNHMGDILNDMDVVDEEDEAMATPIFEQVRAALGLPEDES